MVVTVSLVNDELEMGNLKLENVPIESMCKLDEQAAEDLFNFKYYLYTSYDKVNIIGMKFVILKKTKKTVHLLCVNSE